jgi:hypothetical protein
LFWKKEKDCTVDMPLDKFMIFFWQGPPAYVIPVNMGGLT